MRGIPGVSSARNGFMNSPLWKSTFIFIVTLMLALVGPAAAQINTPKYTVTDLGVLPGDTGSVATSINNSGVVSGNSRVYAPTLPLASAGEFDTFFPHYQGHAFM
jgi:hypothetical protein